MNILISYIPWMRSYNWNQPRIQRFLCLNETRRTIACDKPLRHLQPDGNEPIRTVPTKSSADILVGTAPIHYCKSRMRLNSAIYYPQRNLPPPEKPERPESFSNRVFRPQMRKLVKNRLLVMVRNSSSKFQFRSHLINV